MSLRVEEYHPELHEPVLQKFTKQRGLPAIDVSFLAPTGFVVYFNMKPVCAGFMVKCDNKTAIYQDFLSDPGAPKDMRNKCTEILRLQLDLAAEKAGLQVILCTTAYEAHSERLKGIGYKELNRNLIQLGRFLWL